MKQANSETIIVRVPEGTTKALRVKARKAHPHGNLSTFLREVYLKIMKKKGA